jgi:tetratricopeptide (TPR) repeat protein
LKVEITSTMRFAIFKLFLLSSVLFFGCNPKYGANEIVYTDEQNNASEEVYIDYLTDQIENNPSEEVSYIKLAKFYKDQDKESKAIALLQEAQIVNPKNIAILINLSTFYLQSKNIEKLSRTLNTLREIAPDDVEYLKLSTGYSILLEDYTNAIYFVNRAILLNPYDNESLFLRGNAQLINKDSLNALSSFEEAYQLKNTYTNFEKLFDIALAIGDHQKAGKYLNEITAMNSNLQLCYEWGAYYNKIGDNESSKIWLMKCLNEKPGESRILFELAKSYYGANNIDSAIYFIDKYLDTNPKGTDAYVLKAKSLEKKYQYSTAQNIYIQALEIDSTSILARKGLDNLERKVAYLRLQKRKREVQRQTEVLKSLDSKEIN